MLMPEPALAGPVDNAPTLAERYEETSAATRLRAAIRYLFPGRIALVSSFGADSAVLLHLVAQADPATPVIFVDTGQLFAETLAFRDELIRRFGLTNVTSYRPDATDLAEQDPEDFLWASDPDRCSAKDLLAYMTEHDLPRHPMVEKNYLSIGCVPCTSPVRPGEDARAGRWRGRAKLECGIHAPFTEAGAGI